MGAIDILRLERLVPPEESVVERERVKRRDGEAANG